MATRQEELDAAELEQDDAPLQMGAVRFRSFVDGKVAALEGAITWATAQDVIDAEAAAAAGLAAAAHGDQRGRWGWHGQVAGAALGAAASDVPT